MTNSAGDMFVQCNIFSFGELWNSILAFRGRIKSDNNTVGPTLYSQFSGASSDKCGEMVAYHNTLVM